MSTRFKSVLLTAMLMLLAGGLSKAVVGQLLLYDNFTSAKIDPSKWIGWQGFDPDIRDAARQVVGEEESRRLHLSQTVYSDTGDDSGASGGSFGLGFPDPNAVKEIAFNLVVNNAVAVGCASNPSGQIVTGAEFRGHFFNTEVSPTSSVGEVEVVIGANRNATDTSPALEVLGFYQRCDDAFCGARTNLDFHRLGFVQPGTSNRLHLKWEQQNHRFVFQLNSDPPVLSPYTVSDRSAPVFPFKIIDLARVVPHCTTRPRPFASIDAFFSNVYVNP